MFTRRILEISLFVLYWICLAYPATRVIYNNWLVNELGFEKLIGEWESFIVWLVILACIYLLIRRLLILFYAKCKVSEKRILADVKNTCRDLESGVISANKSTKSSRESLLNDKELLRSDSGYDHSMESLLESYSKHLRHAQSIDNLIQERTGSSLRRGKSVDTFLDTENELSSSQGKSIDSGLDLNQMRRKKSHRKTLQKSLQSQSKLTKSVENLSKQKKEIKIRRGRSMDDFLDGGIDKEIPSNNKEKSKSLGSSPYVVKRPAPPIPDGKPIVPKKPIISSNASTSIGQSVNGKFGNGKEILAQHSAQRALLNEIIQRSNERTKLFVI